MNNFEYTEYTAKNVELPNGDIRWEPTGSVTRKYDWEVKGDRIIVNGKWMRIEYAPDFDYGLRKTKIKSYNLDAVLNKLIHCNQGDIWLAMADHVLSWVVEHGKSLNG